MNATTQQNTVEVETLTELRRYLHAHPELSGKEVQTAKVVEEKLREYHPDQLMTGIGGCGLIAVFDSGQSGATVLFRAELDALPIQEINDFPHRSNVAGVAHKCGHDGHMSILLGLARELRAHPPERGKVLLLFQPAEENGAGAGAMLRDPRVKNLKVDFAFALHNLPGYPKHEILLKAGSFTPAVKSIIIHLHGKTSHAAEPEKGVNPAVAIAELLAGSQALRVPDVHRPDFALLTPVYVRMGEKAYGVSAGHGEVHLTLRTWTEDRMQRLTEKLYGLINRTARQYDLQVSTEWTDAFHANENDQAAVDLIRRSVNELGYMVRDLETPVRWGEDFGLFTQRFPGALFGLGAGEDTPALHNPDYDFPDELIPTGVKVFLGIVRQLLNSAE